VHTLGYERLLEPLTDEARKDPGRVHLGAERMGRPGHVQTLAARHLHERRRPMDPSGTNTVHLE
jgi:hypothetical protein